MTKSDVPQVHKILLNYLKKFDLAPMFDVEECAHFLLPRENVINSYVVEVYITFTFCVLKYMF